MRILSLALAAALAAQLSACSLSSHHGAGYQTGFFIDAATAGLHYETPSRAGITTEGGEFTFQPGEDITFRIGQLEIGRVAARTVITPLEVLGAASASDPQVIALVRLLLSLDEDGNAGNGITIDADDAARLPRQKFSEVKDVDALLRQSGIPRSLVSAEYAQQHFNLSLLGLRGQTPVARFTPLGEQDGQPLPLGARGGCVSDSHTGLVWELKSESGLRAASHRYQPSFQRGTKNGGQCDPALEVCTTMEYVDKVNEQGLCGANDWRAPSEAELKTLLDLTQQDSVKGLPAIDRHAFPDAEPTFYWTDTTRRVRGFLAVWFDDTHKTLPSTSLDQERFGALRLVRGNPIPDPPSKDDVPEPAFVNLNAAVQPAARGEAVLCSDVNTTDLLARPSREELFLLSPSAAGDAANLPQSQDGVSQLIAERNAAGYCGRRDWRLPTLAEMSKLLSLAVDPEQGELHLALPRLDAEASYWVQTGSGMQVISAAASSPQPASRARVLLHARNARPQFVRKRPGADVRPSAAELAQWREQYANYQPGSDTQAAWPVPTLDDSVRSGFADLGLLPAVPFPADNPYSPAKVRLGQKLFSDVRLSRNNQLACISCHNPASGWSDSNELSAGHVGQLGSRNAMTILNTAYVKELFWDGRAKSLEEQALGPIANPDEMHQSLAQAVGKIAAVPEYIPMFAAAFGDDRIDADRMARAIATFERTIISRDSAFDRFLKGDRQALSDDALWGMHLFRTKARCINCHNTPLFSDNKFHSNGLHYYGRELEDLGRYLVTGRREDVSHFRTPTLRDIVYSGNYMHNGLFPMGAGVGVIAMYDAGMVQTLPTGPYKYDPLYPKTSPEVQSLGLSNGEKTALFEFMKAISAVPRTEPASEAELLRR